MVKSAPALAVGALFPVGVFTEQLPLVNFYIFCNLLNRNCMEI